jgi:uncharacterized membrane protein
MVTALRPLTTGELLDRTFSLYRTHFALFAGIVALPHLASLAFQLAGVALVATGTTIFAALWLFFWGLGGAVVGLLVAAASQAATIVAVSQVHLDRPTSVFEAFARVKHKILGVIGLTIVIALGVGMGFILLIVPGVLLTLMWSLAVPVAVLEDKGVGDAMSRSAELTKGDRWRIFVIWLLFLVLSLAVTLLLQWPVTLVAEAMGKTGSTPIIGIQVASAVMSFVSQCLVGPLGTIAFSLVYYDERVRKEAFDLQLMMSTLDGTQVQTAPAGA